MEIWNSDARSKYELSLLTLFYDVTIFVYARTVNK
jgi:hypothetical protein